MRELSTDQEIRAAFPLMRQLRDRIQEGTFLSAVRRQQSEGYRLYGGFESGRLVGLAGARRSHTLARGEHLFVDDLVTEDGSRGQGVGKQMMAWLSRRAAEDGVPRIYLDSRLSARGFYEKLGFTFLTSIPCWIEVE